MRRRLDLPRHALVRHVLCLHLADGRPYQYEDRWIALGLLPQATAADFSVIAAPGEWLLAHIPFSEAEIGIEAIAADPSPAQHLGCCPGDPLLVMERATRWRGHAVTLVRLHHPPGYWMRARG